MSHEEEDDPFASGGAGGGPSFNPPGPLSGIPIDLLFRLLGQQQVQTGFSGLGGLQPQGLLALRGPFSQGRVNVPQPTFGTQVGAGDLSPQELFFQQLLFASLNQPTGGGTDQGFLDLQRDQFEYAQQRDTLDRAIEIQRNAIQQWTAEAQAAAQAGNLEVAQRASDEVQRANRALEQLTQRQLQLNAAIGGGELGLGIAGQNLQQAQFLQEALSSPGNVFSSHFLSRGQAPPSNDMFGLNQLPGAGQPFFGLLNQLPDPSGFFPDPSAFQGQGGPLQQFTPQPFANQPVPFGGGGGPTQSQLDLFGTLPGQQQQQLLNFSPEEAEAFRIWSQVTGGGTPSAAHGGQFVLPGPTIAIDARTGETQFTAGEEGPEIIDIKPISAKTIRKGRGSKGVKSFAHGGRAISGAEGLAALGRALAARRESDPGLTTTQFAREVAAARDAGQRLSPGGRTPGIRRPRQEFVQSRAGSTADPFSESSLQASSQSTEQARIQNLVALRTIGHITQEQFNRSLRTIRADTASDLARVQRVAPGRLGRYSFDPQTGRVVQGLGGTAGASARRRAQQQAQQQFTQVSSPFLSPSALAQGQQGNIDIPAGLPASIADLFGQGFPQFPWLTAMGQGQGIGPADLGRSLQGVPLPSPQFFGNLAPSEFEASGDFFNTVLGVPFGDVLGNSLRPFEGFRTPAVASFR